MVDLPIGVRLKNGAKKLGELWRGGVKCGGGWGLDVRDFPEIESEEKTLERWACPCAEEARTLFCKGKIHWLRLALEFGRRTIETGQEGLANMMTGEEWDLTGLIQMIDIPGIGVVRAGTGKDASIRRADLEKVSSDGLVAVLKIIKVFPGARVEGMENAKPAESEKAPDAEEVEEAIA